MVSASSLKRLFSVHPIMLLAQVLTTALVFLFASDHLRGPAGIHGATIAFIVVRTVFVFFGFYGTIYVVFYVLAPTKRWLARYKIIEQLPRTALVRQEIMRSTASILIASLYEVAVYLAIATGALRVHSLDVGSTVLVTLVVAVWSDLHFFATHRLLHTRFFYKRVHVVHHYSNNPNPFSSFSFHWFEALVYFSATAIVFLIPVSRFHIVFVMMALQLLPAYGHLGFGSETSGSYFHFLHHRKNASNYGASIIWDKLFGTYEKA